MSKIDEILREHLVLATDDGQPYIKYTDNAVAELLQLVLEVIGEDEQQGSVNIRAGELYALRNQLRAEQRKRAKELFGEEQ